MRREIQDPIGGVLDVQVVAHRRSVRTDDRPLVLEDRADGARHQAAPVEVAAAVQIAASGDTNRYAVRGGIRLGQQVGGSLRDVVRVPAAERHVLAVRATGPVSVCLVRRGDDDGSDFLIRSTGLEHAPRALDVVTERVGRILDGGTHEGLGGEVDDGIHPRVMSHASERVGIAHVSVDPTDTLHSQGTSWSVPRDIEPHDRRAVCKELPGNRPAQQTSRPGDEDDPARPGTLAYSHVRQGASFAAHSARR